MRYNPREIEPKWQKRWLKERVYEPDLKRAEKPFYNLMMFPYPSAEGLHVGNMYAFVGADIYGRFKRMQGHDVFEPIGLDGFGIHSENYALKIGKHPVDQSKISEKNFYRQLEIIGNGFAWEERLETYNPDYYKWTQWIFVQMFKRGLAYRKRATVNWCPSCKTVLADEQVIAGDCERCGTKVTERELEQWFFKITQYAERLLENLEKIDWSTKIKIAQKNWIGRSEGALIKFPIPNSQFSITVFTTRPDTLFGATYMVLTPEHELIAKCKAQIANYKQIEEYIDKTKRRTERERLAAQGEKTGVEIKGIKAVNPANHEEIPIWVSDYVLASYGTGAIMAVPAHDERDWEFAKKFGLPIVKVIQPPRLTPPPIPGAGFVDSELKTECWTGEGTLINSGKFNGLPSRQARQEITEFAGGKREVRYRLRDWLISRQRYWGPPIPMIYCEKCGWQAVPEKDLPVKLPYIKDFRPTGTEKSPLALVEKFYKTRCPQCKSWAKRETDVSDTFLDSAWYYLRYPSTHSARSGQVPWDPEITKKWFPVDTYIGGAEHAVLHLLYVRFLAMAFYDWGMIHFDEPFKKFRAHGLLIKEGAKMSKSKGNVVNPDEYIKAYGADALRMYLMFLGPFEHGGDFRDTGIKGITRFLERIWKFAAMADLKNMNGSKRIERILNKTIKKITEDIENLRYNTAISALMIALNEFEAKVSDVSKKHIEIFLKLLAPFAPHLAEELWQELRGTTQTGTRTDADSQGGPTFKSVHDEEWPKYNERLLKEQEKVIVIQVNGRVRDRIIVPADISEGELKEKVLASGKVKKWVGKKKVLRYIITQRVVNVVTE